MEDYSKRKLGVRGPSNRGIFPKFTSAINPSHLPSEISYEYDFGPIFNQGDEPDCEPHALCGIFTMVYHKRTGKWIDFSRAAIYVQGKLEFEGGDFDQEGMFPATGLQLAQAKGNVFELVYPTTDLNVQKRVTVPDELWHKEFAIATFTEVDPDPDSVMLALHRGPIAMAVDWANSFFSPDANGVLPPRDYSAGGHFVVGGAYAKYKPYLPAGGGVKIRNSWSESWGLRGWAWLPFNQLQASAMNFYSIQVSE